VAPTAIPTTVPTVVTAVEPTKELELDSNPLLFNSPTSDPAVSAWSGETVQASEEKTTNPVVNLYNSVTEFWEGYVQRAIPPVQYPALPYFRDGDIIEVANAAYNEFGPKRSVYPRVIRGGCYNDAHARAGLDEAIFVAAQNAFNAKNEGDVFSFPAGNGENGAWFYTLGVESDDLNTIAKTWYDNVSYFQGRIDDQRVVLQLDAMMAVNLVDLNNVGVRHWTKNPGIISVVLCDNVTVGSIAIAFALDDQFLHNYTAGNSNVMPAIFVEGNVGATTAVTYFNSSGQQKEYIQAQLGWIQGDLTVEVPTDGGFVVIQMPVVGSNPNANTEVKFRMGGQQCPDTPGKNVVFNGACGQSGWNSVPAVENGSK
jgi:hypothetical protein